MKIYKNASVLKGEEFVKNDFCVNNGKFEEYTSEIVGEMIDLQGKFVIPGLIDIHSHGSVAVDFNDIDYEKLEKITKFYNSQGVTSVLATILTDTKEKTIECIKEVVSAKAKGVETLLGIHLEGPFLNKEFKGAMPEHLLQKPNIDIFDEYNEAGEGLLKLMTLSPEFEGASELITHMSKKKVVVSIGHTAGTYDDLSKAILAGATNVTHLGNAMTKSTQHDLNIMGGAIYRDELYTEIIIDGFHINENVVRYVFKVRPHDKMILITDSIMAGGLPDGEYMLGVNEVVVINGDAKLKYGDARAGSTLLAMNAVKNTSKIIDKPFEYCVKFMSENPAKSLGIDDRKGRIEQGYDADFVVLNANKDVLETYVLGKRVYLKSE